MRINSLVNAAILREETFSLPAEESHHLARVLRVQPGQKITAFDGQGNVAEAVIESVSKNCVHVRVLARSSVPPPAVQIDLFQAVPKPDRWELVLQKAVELGVSNIYPVLSAHTELKTAQRKEERWQKVVLNAAQQCEERWLPTLHPLILFDATVPLIQSYDMALIGSLYSGAIPFRDVAFNEPKKVALFIGPEGDFTRTEVESAMNANAIPVSFGNRILRTETASIFGLSVLAYRLFV